MPSIYSKPSGSGRPTSVLLCKHSQRRARNHLALLVSVIVFNGCTEQPADRDIAVQIPPSSFAGINLGRYLDCAREQQVTLLQAHRAGDRAGAPENSLAAIDASLADGAVFFEIDVAKTADNVLVLMHDDTLERTTTGTGPLAAQTYRQLADLKLVDVDGIITDEKIPTLRAALDHLKGRGIAQIDRKRSVSFEEIAREVEAASASDRVVFITYSLEDAIAVHRRLPEAMVSTGIRATTDVDRLRAAGVDFTRITAWLGLGSGDPELDTALGELGIETSFGDFRSEQTGSVDYRLLARRGAEVISVDDVPAAAHALDAKNTAITLMQTCDGARAP